MCTNVHAFLCEKTPDSVTSMMIWYDDDAQNLFLFRFSTTQGEG